MGDSVGPTLKSPGISHSHPPVPRNNSNGNAVSPEKFKPTLRVIVNNFPAVNPSRVGIRARLHRVARHAVFEKIIRSTLDQPNHPYSKIPESIRKPMQRALIEELVNSHYLT